MKSNSIAGILIFAGLFLAPAYAKHDHELPPGLQKKAAKGKQLPPGWQKKLQKGEVIDKRVYEQAKVVVPVDSKGLLTISLEGKLVRLYKDTREIVEVLK